MPGLTPLKSTYSKIAQQHCKNDSAITYKSVCTKVIVVDSALIVAMNTSIDLCHAKNHETV